MIVSFLGAFMEEWGCSFFFLLFEERDDELMKMMAEPKPFGQGPFCNILFLFFLPKIIKFTPKDPI